MAWPGAAPWSVTKATTKDYRGLDEQFTADNIRSAVGFGPDDTLHPILLEKASNCGRMSAHILEGATNQYSH